MAETETKHGGGLGVTNELVVVYRDPRELKTDPANARRHPHWQISQLRDAWRKFKWLNPILLRPDDVVGAGNGRLEMAMLEKLSAVPTITLHGLSDAEWKALAIADNKIAANAEWNLDVLRSGLTELQIGGFDLAITGFAPLELGELGIPGFSVAERSTKANNIPAEPKIPVIKPGELWLLGPHRILCGDSTSAEQVARLVGDMETKVPVLHADPPYGMGKQKEGVLNDNLYREKLDAFQMAWWAAWRPFLAGNGSVYIWGNAEDLWRLWYRSGLGTSERTTFRNEIVWDKKTGMGMGSETHRQYATVSERCLFFMLGEQGFGNVNKDDYFEGFEPIRSYLAEQAAVMGWKQKDVVDITGVSMFSHWFTKSQWTMMPRQHYEAFQKRAAGKAFLRPYPELRRLYDGDLKNESENAKRSFYAMRAYFDAAHEAMGEVWEFPRVTGEQRFGHATPKPVEMIGRIVKSSAAPGDIVLEPFAGSGSTLIACEMEKRVCFTMELQPEYVEVVVRRWQQFTGKVATREDGVTLAELEERAA